jgi:TRAP-type mannitol/chloroaromatic compound transport system permease small subunit
MSTAPAERLGEAHVPSIATLLCRFMSWSVVTVLFAFLLNCYLSFWRDWPGAGAAFSETSSALAWTQFALYVAAVAGAAMWVLRTRPRSLRADYVAMTRLATYLVEAAFWMVLLVGVADALISFLRVEGLLVHFVSPQTEAALGRSAWRGPMVHGPLVLLGLVMPFIVRGGMSFVWLALLVVLAELQIVILRFVFSYEQAYMGDLVRLWYAALFLFASAYTLIEEGHVRVDVFYAAFDSRRKGLVNALGSVFLGMTLCWIILTVGMGGASSVINSSLLAWETTQSGFSMYVKYMMAGFLAVFAISMMIQFVSYMMDAIADVRDEPGGRDHMSHATQ